MTEIDARSSITIAAPAERIWNALTTPDLIRQWFFGVETESDWQVGGSLVHRGEWQGKPYEDKGEIVRIEPPRLLVHTHWSAASGLPDRPEHYQEVTWALRDHDGGTELTVSERNLPSDDAKKTSEEAWKAALTSLKTLLQA